MRDRGHACLDADSTSSFLSQEYFKGAKLRQIPLFVIKSKHRIKHRNTDNNVKSFRIVYGGKNDKYGNMPVRDYANTVTYLDTEVVIATMHNPQRDSMLFSILELRRMKGHEYRRIMSAHNHLTEVLRESGVNDRNMFRYQLTRQYLALVDMLDLVLKCYDKNSRINEERK